MSLRSIVGLVSCLSVGLAQEDSGAAFEHYKRASDAYRSRQFKTAIAELNESLSLNPSQLRAVRLLGLCYQLVDQPEQAAAAFIRACRLAPKDAESWFYLGRVYYTQNFFDKALSALTVAVKYAPKDVRIRENLGLTLEALGDAQGAQREYEEAIRWNGGPQGPSATPYLSYGAFLLKMNRTTESEQALTTALRLAPESWQTRFELAKLYYHTDRFDAAVRELKAALKLPSKAEETARTWRLLAGVYSRLARPEDARRAMAAAEK